MRLRFALVSVPLLFGAGCAPGSSSSNELIFCDDRGERYAAGETRAADDACNVCTCGEHGWSCTRHACLPPDTGGRVTGKLSYPSQFLPTQRVCAVNVAGGAEHCKETLENEATYAIEVPPGRYVVHAVRADRPEESRAYYSEYVRCGIRAECRDHTPVIVEVTAAGETQADPGDWYAQGSFESFVIAPSKVEFGALNHYPGSVFQALARGMTKVEIYVATSGTEPALLGEATKTEERPGGVQVWRLPLPPDFTAAGAYALGTFEDGTFARSLPLGKIVPVSAAPPAPVANP